MEHIKVTDKNSVRSIQLSRPEIHNAFNAKMIEELTSAVQNIDENISVIHLSGEGKSFCAGADLTWMKSMVDYTLEENQKDSEVLFDVFAALRECAAPVITQIHGNVFGGGLGLVAASDVVVAEAQTRFCFSEVKLGLVPAVISPFVFQKAQESKCREWMLSGKLFVAKEALAAGLVNFIGEEKECGEYVNQLLSEIVSSGPDAVKETKKLLNQLKSLTWPERREKCSSVIAARRVSEEGQEGLRGFLEKRRPTWKKSLGDTK